MAGHDPPSNRFHFTLPHFLLALLHSLALLVFATIPLRVEQPLPRATLISPASIPLP